MSKQAYRKLGKPEEFCKKRGWINVDDRLPPDGQRVLVYFTDYITSIPNIAISRHTKYGWLSGRACTGNVQFWMPLPEAPKEEAS